MRNIKRDDSHTKLLTYNPKAGLDHSRMRLKTNIFLQNGPSILRFLIPKQNSKILNFIVELE